HQGQFSFANANFQLALPGSSTPIFIGEPSSNHASHMFNPHGLVTGGGAVLKFAMRSTNLLGGILNDGGFIKIENNGLLVGDTVTYENLGAGLDVRGLSGGTNYTVVALEDGTDPNGDPACDGCFIQLAAAPGGAPVEIYDFRIATNPTDGFGGAILVDNPTNRLFLDTVSINAAAADVAGGGIHSVGEVQINNSTFTHNSANAGGAINVGEFAAVLIENSQLNNNQAEFGGAIHLTQGAAVLRSSIVSQNVADFGGAIALNVPNNGFGGVEFWESQLFDNSATSGPAIYTFTDSGGSSLLLSERTAINKNNGSLAHFASDGAGDVQFTSIGFNLTDNQSVAFDNVSDLVDIPVIEPLDRPSVVAGMANAVVAPLGFNPNGVTLDSFAVHDERFVIESGTLRLADRVSLDANDDQLRVDVTALDTDGREWKDYITVEVLPQIGQPQGVEAFPLSATSIGIIWDHADGAEDYQLFEIVDGQPVLVANLSVDTISYVVDGLAPNSSHQFFVRAVNAGGSADSNTISASTERPLPVSVWDATIDSLGATTAHVSWEAAEFEDALRIDVLNDSGEIVVSESLPAGTTEFTLSGL
ncbi:MAG: fibronectin type III domain-containing protein, partial [Planctomycetota bacterium]